MTPVRSGWCATAPVVVPLDAKSRSGLELRVRLDGWSLEGTVRDLAIQVEVVFGCSRFEMERLGRANILCRSWMARPDQIDRTKLSRFVCRQCSSRASVVVIFI